MKRIVTGQLKEENTLLTFIQYCQVRIKTISFIYLIFLIVLPFIEINAQDYKLVWSDEFDGAALDLTKWEYQLGNGTSGLSGWGNNEKEYYREENAVVNNGYLTITAKQENFSGFNYTSSRMRTINKGDWKYGKIEMRAKMPIGKGMWPAFWMMPTDNVYGGWAASGEIDLMEYLGHDAKKVYGTIHYGGTWPKNQSSGGNYTLPSGGFNDDFHTFTFIWEERKMQWLVDGKVYSTKTNWSTEGFPFPAPFDQRFHIILNLAVGGNWPGYPDSTTVFPQEFIIDYVRVYQISPTGVQEEKNKIADGFVLKQNYPNPFNSETIITYEITKPDYIKLSIYDMLGRTISILVDQFQNPGRYSVSFNAANLSSGIYTYRLNTSSASISRKLILIK
jgi:beta-glucanase (GH16 family)